MAVWTKPVAWSKFKLALTCPKQLEYTLDHTPTTVIQRGWYAGLGHAVQKVFELYYNQGLWEHERTRTAEVFREIARRVLEQSKFDGGTIVYDQHLSRPMLEQEVYEQVENGRKILSVDGLLEVRLRSEHGWGATFRNMRLYGMIDFIQTHMNGDVSLFDGKGSQQKNADPRQLLYYALVLHASGRKVRRAALIYWKHGMVEVDVSMEALKQFVDNDFARGSELFQRLKGGVSDLQAVPNKEHCGWCSWRTMCKESPYRTPDFVPEGSVDLGGVDGK